MNRIRLFLLLSVIFAAFALTASAAPIASTLGLWNLNGDFVNAFNVTEPFGHNGDTFLATAYPFANLTTNFTQSFQNLGDGTGTLQFKQNVSFYNIYDDFSVFFTANFTAPRRNDYIMSAMQVDGSEIITWRFELDAGVCPALDNTECPMMVTLTDDGATTYSMEDILVTPGGAEFQAGTAYHIGITWDKSEGNLSFWVDGLLTQTQLMGFSDFRVDNFNMTIGGRATAAPAVQPPGIYGAISFFSKELTPNEVLTLNLCAEIPCPAPSVAAETTLSVTAIDRYDLAALSNFTVTVSNSTFTLINSTQSGTALFGGLANLTTYTINLTSNDTGGYFDDFGSLEVNLTSTFEFKPYQTVVTFNASQLFTQLAISGINVSTPVQGNSTNGSTVDMFLRLGTYTILANATGQFPGSNVTFTVAALERSNQSFEFGNVFANITVFNSLTNQTISDGFTATIKPINASGSVIQTTTSSFMGDIILIKGHNYSVAIDFTAPSFFADVTQTFTTIDTDGNWSIFSQQVHTVNIQFFIETSNQQFQAPPIQNETITLDMIGPFVGNFSTDNGTLFITNLTPGIYELVYESPNTDKRSYFINLIAGGNDDLDLYLLNKTLSTLVIPVIVDENDNPINGSILQIQRQYIDEGGIFKIVEMSKANFNGEAPVNVVLDTQDYRFVITLNNEVIFTSTKTKITDTALRIQVVLGVSPFEFVDGLTATQTSLTSVSDGANQTYTYTTVDTTGFTQSSRLLVTKQSLDGESILCDLSATGSSTTIICNVNATGQILAQGSIVSGGQGAIITNVISFLISPVNVFGSSGPFLGMLLFMTLMFVAVFSVEATLIMSIIGLMVAALLGLFPLGLGALFSMLGATLIIMIRGRGN